MTVYKTLLLLCLFTEGIMCEDLCGVAGSVNQTTEHMHIFDFYSRSDNMIGTHFDDVFFHEVNNCNWKTVLLLTSDGNAQLVNFIMDLFNSHAISFVYYYTSIETNEAFAATVWHLYNEKKFTNIVWLGRHLELLMTVLKTLFDSECHRLGAMMPHDLHIVVVIDSDDLQKVGKLLEDSVFDNVAVFATRKNSFVIENIYTLIWQKHKRRKLELAFQFEFDAVLEENVCRMFPNVYRGMNGRVLKGVAKLVAPFLHITENEKYSGFIVYILNTLAIYLNFTYILEPDPKNKSYMTWEHFRSALSEAKVDFGAAVATINYINFWNMSVTYPVMFGNISGVYVQHEKNRLSKLKAFLVEDVYIACLGCLVFVVIMYAFMQRIIKEKKLKILRNKAIIKEKSNTESGEELTVCELSIGFTELFFGLFGSLLNQDNIPFPKHISLGILIWTWRLVVFVVTTAFTSNMTAYLIDSYDSMSVSSVDEIIARGDYVFGADIETAHDLLMMDVGQDITAKQIFVSKVFLSNTHTHDYLSTNEVISKLESGKHVAFVFSPIVELWYKKQMKNLVRMPDAVMSANLGIPFPEDSTLQKVFSDAIIKLTDCGFLGNVERAVKWNVENSEKEVEHRMHLPVDVQLIFDYLILCFYLLSISMLTLIVECVFVKIKTFIGKFMKKVMSALAFL